MGKRKYLQLESGKTKLKESWYNLFTANGNSIELYGELKSTLNLRDSEFIVDFLVGDIQQDADTPRTGFSFAAYDV